MEGGCVHSYLRGRERKTIFMAVQNGDQGKVFLKNLKASQWKQKENIAGKKQRNSMKVGGPSR